MRKNGDNWVKLMELFCFSKLRISHHFCWKLQIFKISDISKGFLRILCSQNWWADSILQMILKWWCTFQNQSNIWALRSSEFLIIRALALQKWLNGLFVVGMLKNCWQVRNNVCLKYFSLLLAEFGSLERWADCTVVQCWTLYTDMP